MADQIISREKIRQSATEIFLSGGSIVDCPYEMEPYRDEWEEEYRRVQFEIACTSN